MGQNMLNDIRNLNDFEIIESSIGWYDGYTDGILIHNSEQHLFIISDALDDGTRIFSVYRLTPYLNDAFAEGGLGGVTKLIKHEKELFKVKW